METENIPQSGGSEVSSSESISQGSGSFNQNENTDKQGNSQVQVAPKTIGEKLNKISKSVKEARAKEEKASVQEKEAASKKIEGTVTAQTGTVPGAAAPVVPVVPQYTPNYKFKSYDKEYEFDEWLKPLIKDKELEDKARDLYTKAYSMDILKPKYQETRDKYQDLQTKHKTMNENIQMLESYLNAGDVGSFLSALKIPDQMIYKHVFEKLQYKDLPPEQRMQVDQFNETRQRAIALERQNLEYQQKWQNEAVQLRTVQLDSVLSRPDIRAIADAYDTRKGQAGSFRQRVVNEGKYHFNASGRDITPEEAVKEVLSYLEIQPQGQAAETNQAVAAPTQQVVAQPKPVIPNISGKATSPVKKSPTTIKDLRKLAMSM